MLKKIPLYFIKYSILPAILYIIPLIIFVIDETFSETWLLYLGNALFLCYIFVFAVHYAKQQNNRTSPLSAGLTVTIISIIFTCILVLVVIFIFAPGVFHTGSSAQGLKNTPAALPDKNSHGVIFMLFANATIGNFTAGSVSSVLAAGATKQTRMRD
jgi:hypothetical protein